jgi:hypothetical protein
VRHRGKQGCSQLRAWRATAARQVSQIRAIGCCGLKSAALDRNCSLKHTHEPQHAELPHLAQMVPRPTVLLACGSPRCHRLLLRRHLLSLARLLCWIRSIAAAYKSNTAIEDLFLDEEIPGVSRCCVLEAPCRSQLGFA